MKLRSIILLNCILAPITMHAQISNAGFEDWSDIQTPVYEAELLSVFNIPEPTAGYIDNWNQGSEYGITRTTDAYEGTYSLIVHNWYGYANEWIEYKNTLNYRPNYLTGYYKYNSEANFDGEIPNGIGRITIYGGGDTICHSTHYFDSTASYKPFTINLNYLSNTQPDSVTIRFENSALSCNGNIVCDFLYLDKISFDNPAIFRDC